LPTAAIAAVTCVLCLACVARTTAQEDKTTTRTTMFAVYALSRGKGVPDATRAAFVQIRELFGALRREGRITRLHETRLGLEGETRLCVEFKDPRAAADALGRVRKIAAGVELLNVVEEACKTS
jgi:hypothetical protein